MYIPDKKVVFVQIPKCASTSMLSAISSRFEVNLLGTHVTMRQYVNRFPEAIRGISVVRNPVDRLVSAVNFTVGKYYKKSEIHKIKFDIESSLGERQKPIHLSLFYPQYSFLMSNTPLSLYTLPNASLCLSDLGAEGKIPCLNRSFNNISKSEVIECFGESFIKDFYLVDHVLYSEVESVGHGFMSIPDATNYFHSARGKNAGKIFL